MNFDGIEITQEEQSKFVNAWDLDKLKQDLPSSYPSVIRSIKQRVLESREDARIERMVACLSKWCWVTMGIYGDKTQPNLDKPLPTKEDVNKFKANVRKFWKDELYQGEMVKPYWLEQGIDQLPPWDNLKEHSWLAFYQEFRRL